MSCRKQIILWRTVAESEGIEIWVYRFLTSYLIQWRPR
jgi:hypothetical protein